MRMNQAGPEDQRSHYARSVSEPGSTLCTHIACTAQWKEREQTLLGCML